MNHQKHFLKFCRFLSIGNNMTNRNLYNIKLARFDDDFATLLLYTKVAKRCGVKLNAIYDNNKTDIVLLTTTQRVDKKILVSES